MTLLSDFQTQADLLTYGQPNVHALLLRSDHTPVIEISTAVFLDTAKHNDFLVQPFVLAIIMGGISRAGSLHETPRQPFAEKLPILHIEKFWSSA